MINPPTLVVTSVNGFGETDSGRQICVDCVNQSGQRFILQIPFEKEGEFLAYFQGAAQHAARARGTPAEPKTLTAMAVQNVRLGIADDETIVLLLELPSGLVLNLALDAAAQHEFRRGLAELADFQRRGGPGIAQ